MTFPLTLRRFAHCVYTPGLSQTPLHPETQAMLAGRKSHPKAFDESQKGRICAQRAVHVLTGEIVPILTGLSREPLWPEGLTGSITHTDDYIAAVAAPCQQGGVRVKGVGYDAETTASVSMDIIDKIAAPREQNWIREARAPRNRLAQIFSMKEALFKALNPETGIAIGFLEIEIMPVLIHPDFYGAIIIDMSPRVAACVAAEYVWIESWVTDGVSLATVVWIEPQGLPF